MFNEQLISNLFLLTLSLKMNGFEVVWGYSDIVGVASGATGVDASGSGWFGTLRNFSLNGFLPAKGGGQRPRPKFFSVRLLNRILLGEINTALAYDSQLLNGLASDQPFLRGNDVIEPNDETVKCLQGWGALKRLQEIFSPSSDALVNLEELRTHVGEAIAAYQGLGAQGMNFESATSAKNLFPLLAGIDDFIQQL